MKKIILPLAVLAVFSTLTACTTSTNQDTGEQTMSTTLGDGVFDAKEQVYFRTAIGLGLSAYPAAATPAYFISTSLLGIVSADSVASNDILVRLIDEQVSKAEIDADVEDSVFDLVDIVKLNMLSVLDGNNIVGADRLGIVKQMLVIIQAKAKARMI